MKIICIGRNYAEHAKELGNEVPTSPLIFMKPSTAMVRDNKPFYYPSFTKDLHHEVELVLKINKHGKSIKPEFAHKYYDSITVGIDFTARDIQAQCKEKGHPWEVAKSWDNSAPIGRFISLEEAQNEDGMIEFALDKNGETVQFGSTKDLIHDFDQLIAYISQFFTLQKGDLIFTGTPKGVAPVQIGDRLEASIKGETLLAFDVK